MRACDALPLSGVMLTMTECSGCAHSIEPTSMPDPNDPTKTLSEKGHKDVGGNLVCLQCGEVCKLSTPTPAQAPAATPAAPTVTTSPSNVRELAEAVAGKMASMRDEMIWKDLQSPGVIIRLVDGGYLIENRWGDIAVRTDVEQAMTKVKEWLVPRV